MLIGLLKFAKVTFHAAITPALAAMFGGAVAGKDCASEKQLATERNSAPNATSHAPPSAPDHCFLEAIFFVARMTLYYAGVSKRNSRICLSSEERPSENSL